MSHFSGRYRSLPNEVLLHIVSFCSPSAQACLTRTSKRVQAITEPLLYNRVVLNKPTQGEKFCRTILQNSKDYANLVKGFSVLMIYVFDKKTFMTLLNKVLGHLVNLQALRIIMETTGTPLFIGQCLSNCTFPNLRKFDFGHTSELSAHSVYEFLQRHPKIQHIMLETDKYLHSIVPDPTSPLPFPELKSYTGPIRFLPYIAPRAPFLTSILIKLSPVTDLPLDPGEIEVVLNSLSAIPNKGKNISVIVDASMVSTAFILDCISTELPKLHSLTIYCRTGEPLYLNTSPQSSQVLVDGTKALFAKFEALRKFVYSDPPIFKLPKIQLSIGDDVKTLGSVCQTLKEISLYNKRYIRKDIGGWSLV